LDTYRVEWSRDGTFGTREVKAFTVVNDLPSERDSNGFFTLTYAGRTTAPLSPFASAQEVADSLSALGSTGGPVEVTRSVEAQRPGSGFTWTVTFTNDVGPLVKSGYLCRSCVTGITHSLVNLTSYPPGSPRTSGTVGTGGASNAMQVVAVGDILLLSSLSTNSTNSSTLGPLGSLVSACTVTVTGVKFFPSAPNAIGDLMDEAAAAAAKGDGSLGTASLSVTGFCNLTGSHDVAVAAAYVNDKGLSVDTSALYSTSGNGSLRLDTRAVEWNHAG